MAEIAQCGSRSFRAELKSVPEIFRNHNSLTSYSNNDILMLSKEKDISVRNVRVRDMCKTVNANLCKRGGHSESVTVSSAQYLCVNKFNMVIKA